MIVQAKKCRDPVCGTLLGSLRKLIYIGPTQVRLYCPFPQLQISNQCADFPALLPKSTHSLSVARHLQTHHSISHVYHCYVHNGLSCSPDHASRVIFVTPIIPLPCLKLSSAFHHINWLLVTYKNGVKFCKIGFNISALLKSVSFFNF
jgi:hypothetical protein